MRHLFSQFNSRYLLPILLQLRPSAPLPPPKNTYQVVVDHKYIPDGLEDATAIGNSTLAIWKEEGNVCINFRQQVFRYPLDQSELVVTVDKDTATVTVNNKSTDPTPMQNLLTDAVMKKMILNRNSVMFNQMAKHAQNSIFTKGLLALACIHGPASCFRTVMDITKIGPDTLLGYNGYGWSGIQLAAVNGRDTIVTMMVGAHGAGIDHTDIVGCSALSWAIACKHLSTVKILVGLGYGRKKVVTVRGFVNMKLYYSSGYIVNSGSSERVDIETYLASQGVRWKYE